MSESERPTATQRLRGAVDGLLRGATPGLEEVVSTEAFGAVLAQAAGNLVAVNRISAEVLDLLIRNARLSGRADHVALARQLGRTEDKLEQVLEIVERLEADLRAERARNDELVKQLSDKKSTPRTAAASARTRKVNARAEAST